MSSQARPLRFSVAMATYNGGAYVGQQLASMAAQDRLPDELIVTDDGSTDDTLEIIERFASGAPFAVHVHRNASNLRVTKNFEKAIGLCTGDIIVLSDQDDVWRPDKIQLMAEAFADPAVGLVFSDADVVDQQLGPLGYRLWQSIHLRGRRLGMVRRGRTFETMLAQYVVTGATAAFRASLRDVLLPIPPGWIHDGWCALLAAACSKVVAIEEPLIRYRQHVSQQIGAPRLTFRRLLKSAMELQWGPYCQKETDNFAAALERLSQHEGRLVAPRALVRLERKVRHMSARAAAHDGRGRARRLALVTRELLGGRYFHYSSFPLKAAAVDLVL